VRNTIQRSATIATHFIRPQKRALALVGVGRVKHLEFRFVEGRTTLVELARPFALDYDAMWHWIQGLGFRI